MARKIFKLVLLGLPWLVIWLLGVSCALISDAFAAVQDRLAKIAKELNEEIQKL